jgi:energy-coupling factor transporter ATP-binding protein EcfA2
MIIWITGQPGAGKTTLALALQQAVYRTKLYDTVVLDGDDLRRMSLNTDYSKPGRVRNIQRAIATAIALDEDDTMVICAFVSPYRVMREQLKWCGKVVEVYVHTTRTDTSKPAPCLDYEPPTAEFVDVDTDQPIGRCVDIVMQAVANMLQASEPSFREGEAI